MELSPPPPGLEAEYEALCTTDSLLFLHELISTFDEEVVEVGKLNLSCNLMHERLVRKSAVLCSGPADASVQKSPLGPLR